MMVVDFSDELQIYRTGNGIRIISPYAKEAIKQAKFLSDTGHTLGSIVKLPFAVYLEDLNHIAIKSNEQTAEACGFASLGDYMGKSPFKYFKRETILPKLENHKKVLVNNKVIIAEEEAERKDGSKLSTLSVRMPWYSKENKIMGLFGCSIVLGVNSLADSLKIFTEMGLLSNACDTHFTKNLLHLTSREKECLLLTIRGMSAKQIAYELNLSKRTVEEYLTNLKVKMKVFSKSALIDKGLEYFYTKLR